MLSKTLPSGQNNHHRSNQALLVADPNTSLIQAGNAVTCLLLKYSQDNLSGKSLHDMLTNSVIKKIKKISTQNAGQEREDKPFRTKITSSDERLIPVEMSVYRMRMNGKKKAVILFSEIPLENKSDVEESFSDKRLEALSIYTSGIVHDLNNIFSVIHGYAYLVLDKTNEESPSFSYLEKINRSLNLAEKLTKKIKEFSANKKITLCPVKMKPVIEEIARFMEISLRHKIKITLSLEEDLPDIAADETGIKQILMNLILNAAEAIEIPDGVIEIRLSQKECSSSYLQQTLISFKQKSGKYLALEVIDNGCGMPGDYLQSIFTPFVSKKAHGRGLGLAAVSQIMKEHGGTIDVQSTAGCGTHFTLLFPIYFIKNSQVLLKEEV